MRMRRARTGARRENKTNKQRSDAVQSQEIAVVGGGIAGMGAAWLLSGRHRVTLFEAEEYIGGHTRTVEAALRDGRYPVDTGFMVYNARNYPHLCALLDALGIAGQDSDMSFACADREADLEYSGESLGGLFAQRRNLLRPYFLRMVADILRFNRRARRALAAGLDERLTLGEYLDASGLGDGFRRYYLLPMAAAIWSCSPRSLRQFPAARFLRFFDNHGLLDLAGRPQWRTIPGGAQRYAQALLGALPRAHAATPVRAVQRPADGGVRLLGDDGELGRFDQAVLACHADQALGMLEAPSEAERRLLGAFQFQDNAAVLHTDPAAMPRRRRVWASWNHISAADEAAEGSVSVTYWLNRLQRIASAEDAFLSLNPVDAVDEGRVLARLGFRHPIFDRETARAQDGLDAVQGRDRLWVCGAWTGYGFHEDGLRSAVRVAGALGCPPPWQAPAAPLQAADTPAASTTAAEEEPA